MAVAVLDLQQAVAFNAYDIENGLLSEEEASILEAANRRRSGMMAEQNAFSAQCDRWDSLYFPPEEAILPQAGVSHWWWHSSAKQEGKAHLSINTPPLYVDIPAALQAVTPIENIVPAVETEEARLLSSMVERLFFSWKAENDFDVWAHRACVVKGLYGRTAGKVWWDDEKGFPVMDIIDQPRNLWLGWGQSDYRSLDWAAYTYTMTAESVFAEFGLACTERTTSAGLTVPYLVPISAYSSWTEARQAMWSSGGSVEVTDYWYRQPRSDEAPDRTKVGRVTHDTWNALIVGNRVVQNRKFPEYGGRIPYVPLFNSFVPGVPNGRPELFDIEQLIREKDERMTNAAQLMHNIVNAQYWQLVGPDAPDEVPVGLRPKANQVIAPGGGNRVEGITPWFPEFQVEQYLARIDREMIDVSGLNDLLRGMAPASVMSSSKAINALVANYETRISMKRAVFYRWRREMWGLTLAIWKEKEPELSPMFEAAGRLDIIPPSLTPRDDMEAATIATQLSGAKIWANKRAMDRTGVDDPEAEEEIIRGEQTDPALNPAAVQVMAQLAQILQSLGFQNAEQAAGALGGGGGMEQGAMMAQMRGEGMPPGQVGSGETPATPPEMMPGNTPEGQAVGAGPTEIPPLQEGSQVLAQTQVKEGEASNRLLFQQQIGEEAPPEEA